MDFFFVLVVLSQDLTRWFFSSCCAPQNVISNGIPKDGFAQTLDLQGVNFRAPGEGDNEESTEALSQPPHLLAIAESDLNKFEDCETKSSMKLMDTLVHAYCSAPTCRLNT